MSTFESKTDIRSTHHNVRIEPKRTSGRRLNALSNSPWLFNY